jgi:hypothetical protein
VARLSNILICRGSDSRQCTESSMNTINPLGGTRDMGRNIRAQRMFATHEITNSTVLSAKRLDWRRPHVRNAIALLGVALLFVALQFYDPKFLQCGIDYNASEMREASSKLVLLP